MLPYPYKTYACTYCGKPVVRSYFSVERYGRLPFCAFPSYCRFAHLHKIRDPRGYEILQNFNDPDFYYLIGLICSDGDISFPKYGKEKKRAYRAYACSINLHKKDASIVRSIKKKFGGTYYYLKDGCVRWMIQNKYFIEYLKDTVGLTKNKSKTMNVLSYFESLTSTQKRHFLRGIVDGDGSVAMYKKKDRHNTYSARFSVCSGSKKFIDMLVQYFSSKFKQKNANLYVYNKWCNCHYLLYNGSYAVKPLRYLYKDIQHNPKLIHVKRKYDVFLEIEKYYRSRQ